MDGVDWIIIICIIVFTFLAVWGIKFPRAKQDWKKDRIETFSLLISSSIFLLLFLLLWYVVSIVEWPDAMDIVIWACIIMFFFILLLAVVYPGGLKIKFNKKTKEEEG